MAGLDRRNNFKMKLDSVRLSLYRAVVPSA